MSQDDETAAAIRAVCTAPAIPVVRMLSAALASSASCTVPPMADSTNTTDQDLDPYEAELVDLWGDFAHELDYAQCAPVPEDPDSWSTGMLNKAERIGRMTRAGHTTSQGSVQAVLVEGGWWEAVHQHADAEQRDDGIKRHVAQLLPHYTDGRPMLRATQGVDAPWLVEIDGMGDTTAHHLGNPERAAALVAQLNGAIPPASDHSARQHRRPGPRVGSAGTITAGELLALQGVASPAMAYEFTVRALDYEVQIDWIDDPTDDPVEAAPGVYKRTARVERTQISGTPVFADAEAMFNEMSRDGWELVSGGVHPDELAEDRVRVRAESLWRRPIEE